MCYANFQVKTPDNMQCNVIEVSVEDTLECAHAHQSS